MKMKFSSFCRKYPSIGCSQSSHLWFYQFLSIPVDDWYFNKFPYIVKYFYKCYFSSSILPLYLDNASFSQIKSSLNLKMFVLACHVWDQIPWSLELWSKCSGSLFSLAWTLLFNLIVCLNNTHMAKSVLSFDVNGTGFREEIPDYFTGCFSIDGKAFRLCLAVVMFTLGSHLFPILKR